MQRSLLYQNHGFKVADRNSVKQFIEDQENENTRNKSQQNVALIKEFLTLRNELQILHALRPQFIHWFGRRLSTKASKQCQSLPVLLFLVVNSTSLSAALINLTEMKSRKRYKRLKVLDSDSVLKPCVGLKANVNQYIPKLQ